MSGETGHFDCPFLLRLFGTSEALPRQQLEARMKSDKLPLMKVPKERKIKTETVTAPRKELGYKGTQSTGDCTQPEEEKDGVSMEQLVTGSERFRARKLEELIEHWGAPEDMLENIPSAGQPKRMKAQLLPYQLQVRTFCVLSWIAKSG